MFSNIFSRTSFNKLKGELFLNEIDIEKNEIQKENDITLVDLIKEYDPKKATLLDETTEDIIYINKNIEDYFNYRINTSLKHQEIIEKVLLNILQKPRDIFKFKPAQKIIDKYETYAYNIITNELFRNNCDFSDDFKTNIKDLIKNNSINKDLLYKENVSLNTEYPLQKLVFTISLPETLTNTTVGISLSHFGISPKISLFSIFLWHIFCRIRALKNIINIISNVIILYISNDKKNRIKIVTKIKSKDLYQLLYCIFENNSISINSITIDDDEFQEYKKEDNKYDYNKLFTNKKRQLINSKTKISIDDHYLDIDIFSKDVTLLLFISTTLISFGIGLMAYYDIIPPIIAIFCAPFLQIIVYLVIHYYSEDDYSLHLHYDISNILRIVDSLKKLRSIMREVIVTVNNNVSIIIDLDYYASNSLATPLLNIAKLIKFILEKIYLKRDKRLNLSKELT